MQTVQVKNNSILTHAAVWLGLLVLSFMLLLPVLHAQFAIIRATAVISMLAVAHYTNVALFNRTVLAGKMHYYVVTVAAAIVLLSVVRFLLETFIFPVQTQPQYFQVNPFRPVFYILTTGFVFLVSGMILYTNHLADNEKLLLHTINVHNEARLQYLQSQINPHFLFNALNNVYSQVVSKSESAPETLLLLTDLLRYSVYQKPREKVLVNEEAEQIDILIKLFSLRSDEPYSISFTKNVLSGMIEPMVLIPIAENCLKHCDFDLSDKAYANMLLQADTKGLIFETENTYNPTQKKNEAGGVGLKNIKERLDLIYGDGYMLDISKTENLFRVKLQITWNE